MALTVKDLREMLNVGLRDDAIIMDIQRQDFVHIITDGDGNLMLSTSRPIGVCNRSGEYVYPSVVEGYVGYCPETDEDLYEIEFKKINHEKGERG